jgi:hypothetical protein
MDERVIFAGVKFWNNGLSKVFVLYFRELELGHVFLKSFRPEADFVTVRMRPRWRSSEWITLCGMVEQKTTTS